MVKAAISDSEPPRCPICDYAVSIPRTSSPDQSAGIGAAGAIQCPRCQSELLPDASGEFMIRMAKTSAQRIASELTLWRTSDRRATLPLDFSDVAFLNTEMLDQLILLHQSQFCSPVLCNLSPQILEVLRITKLSHVLDVRSGD